MCLCVCVCVWTTAGSFCIKLGAHIVHVKRSKVMVTLRCLRGFLGRHDWLLGCLVQCTTYLKDAAVDQCLDYDV